MCIYLHDAFYVGAKQRIPKLILNKIINVDLKTILLIKGCELFNNFIYNAMHHKQFGLGLTATIKLHRRKCLYLKV